MNPYIDRASGIFRALSVFIGQVQEMTRSVCRFWMSCSIFFNIGQHRDECSMCPHAPAGNRKARNTGAYGQPLPKEGGLSVT